VSDTRTADNLGQELGTADAGRTTQTGRNPVRLAVMAVVLVLLLITPIYVGPFWLGLGFVVMAAAVGAIGLNLLVGTSGQLSLAHAFFLAVGATTYTYVAGESAGRVDGLGLPPLLGMVLGVLLAGALGALFSPIAARLRGIYLGVASIGLVFIGLHLMNTWERVTGGFNGRAVPQFSLFGWSFGANEPYLAVAGVPFGASERRWYLGLVIAVAAYLLAKNILRSRAGRALVTLRDSEVAASVMGVNVQNYKGRIFLISSMYAGMSGVLYAMSIGSIAPESFALDVSILYLAMIVLGGLGSVAGAALGALFVASLPLLFQQYAGVLPLIVEPGQPGVTAGQAARFLFGLAIVLVVLFEPAGLVGFANRVGRKTRRRQPAPPAPTAEPTPSHTPAQGSS
jgi:branched-chain amino acid transport system permease protein